MYKEGRKGGCEGNENLDDKLVWRGKEMTRGPEESRSTHPGHRKIKMKDTKKKSYRHGYAVQVGRPMC